jgi:hypothetical protein
MRPTIFLQLFSNFFGGCNSVCVRTIQLELLNELDFQIFHSFHFSVSLSHFNFWSSTLLFFPTFNNVNRHLLGSIRPLQSLFLRLPALVHFLHPGPAPGWSFRQWHSIWFRSSQVSCQYYLINPNRAADQAIHGWFAATGMIWQTSGLFRPLLNDQAGIALLMQFNSSQMGVWHASELLD